MKSKAIICFFLILAVGIFVSGIYLPRSSSKEEVVFSVEKGQGSREIASNLEKAGLIRFSPFFRVFALLSGNSGSLQAGDYSLSPSMNIPEITEKISKGDTLKIKLTIPEGFNLKQISLALQKAGLGNEEGKKSLVETGLAQDFKKDFSFLEEVPSGASLEGFLFPDTYDFALNAAENKIIFTMLDNFNEKFSSELRDEAKKQNKSIFEIITMASMIEREVKNKEDKELVSGILWKRLESNMPLQIDATINYVTGNLQGGVSLADTKIKSPYNTYSYKGLPVGPISNPGLESIEAALYPKTSPYWYYLSAKEGQTIFSRTLEEHVIAKNKHLR